MFQVPAKGGKRQYELTFLVPGNSTSTEVKAVLDSVTKLIKKVKGQITEVKDWGKRDLAYVIKKQGKKHRQAIYTHLLIELEASQAPVLEREILLLPDIIRHLLVVADHRSATKLATSSDQKRV